MRERIVIIVLIIVSILLGAALIRVSKNVEVQKVDVVKTITDFSNTLGQASTQLEEQRQVNIFLTNKLDTEEKKVTDLIQQTNRLAGELQRVTGERDEYRRTAEEVARAAAEAAKIAQQEIERRTAKITELEKERETLTKQMGDLTNQIALLEVKISETEKKLAASEGQNDFLLKELKRLQAEKAELERQFNDLKIVKEQVKKLTEEHHVALRLEWMRRGLYNEMKGAELLMQPRPKPRTNYNLDVEIRRGAPPTIKSGTNAPAPTK
jgi:chromosome segregation ATPase